MGALKKNNGKKYCKGRLEKKKEKMIKRAEKQQKQNKTKNEDVDKHSQMKMKNYTQNKWHQLNKFKINVSNLKKKVPILHASTVYTTTGKVSL